MSSTAYTLDAWLDDQVGERASLCPERSRPTPFTTLWSSLDVDAEHRTAIVSVTEQVARSIAAHYPDNVFWDLDRIVQALSERESVAAIESTGARLVRLMRGFGMNSEIRFRYVHDFTYGFDWAKWVARDPETRSGTRPFDERFLEYLEARQRELLGLIDADDATYGQLRGDGARNPFGFSREPEDERRLHELLAERGQVPVETWQRKGPERWGEHFAKSRALLADELGLAR
ncbi:MAG: ferrochelatase [Myxococcota bacterium]